MNPEEPNVTRSAPTAVGASADKPAHRTRRQEWLMALVITYGVLVAGMWALMFFGGDRHWLGTLVLFGPRWICGLPLPPLMMAAGFWYRRLLGPLAMMAIVLLFPIMGFTAHWPARDERATLLRVLTCNVDQNNIRPAVLAALIASEKPDVVALQEVSSATRYAWPDDWHVLHRDEFILASRWPITERRVERFSVPRSDTEVAAIYYAVQWSRRDVQLFNLHLESPRAGLEAVLSQKPGNRAAGAGQFAEVTDLRRRESEQVSRWLNRFGGAKIVAGDFNMPIESTIYRQSWATWENAFSSAGRGLGFTKRSQMAGWTYGTRIDHVLFTPPWRCVRCIVGDDVGSDHFPLIADFEWQD